VRQSTHVLEMRLCNLIFLSSTLQINRHRNRRYRLKKRSNAVETLLPNYSLLRQHLEFLGVRWFLIALALTCTSRTQAAIKWRCVLRSGGANDGKCFWTLRCCSILPRGMQGNWSPALWSRTPRMFAVLCNVPGLCQCIPEWDTLCVEDVFHNHETGQ
jgi:hypothetical protein